MAEPVYRTIVEALEAGKGVHGRGYTFIGPGGEEKFLSHDELRREAISRAHHLRALGLKKGDRLAMVLPDGGDFIPTFFGALWAGIVPVPLYPPLSLGKLDAYHDTLLSILKKAEPAYLVTTERVQNILWSLIGKVPSLQGIVTADQFAKPAEGAREEPEAIGPEDLCFLQFTSGSTSTPKGVAVTHASLSANCRAIAHEGLKLQATDEAVSWLPLYHDMGLIGFVMVPLMVKCNVHFIPTLSFVKNATTWMEVIHKKRGTVTFAPNFAYALVTKRAKAEQLARWDLSSMRAFGCGAEPIHPETIRQFLDKFAAAKLKREAMLPCYGMAEATLAISFVGLDEPFRVDRIDAGKLEAEKVATAAVRPDAKGVEVVCCGRPFENHEVAIFGEDGRRLPERTVGEIAFRGPSVTQGYFRDPEATAKAFRDGFLFTGDLGYLAQGQVHITGRKKDLIIIKGRNYDPQRIEWLVNEMPGVRKGSAVAFSRPGAESEELVVAAESRDQNPDALRQAISQKINEQLQLAAAEVVLVAPGALPKTSSGKLQRQKTRAQYLDGTIGTEGVRTIGGTSQRLSLAKHVTLSWVGRGRHMARGLLRRAVNRLTGTAT